MAETNAERRELKKLLKKAQQKLRMELTTKTQYIEKSNNLEAEVNELISTIKAKDEELAQAKAKEQEFLVIKDKYEELQRTAASKVNNTVTVSADRATVESLEACKNSLSEMKKKNDIQSKQLSMYVEELRKSCALNIDMRGRLEDLIKDKEQLLQSVDQYKYANETLRKEKEDFSEQVRKNIMRETELKNTISELESKIVKADSLAYVYNMKSETMFGAEDIQLMIRKRLKGDFVLDFETSKKDRFIVTFNSIRNIEKDMKDERKLKIVQDRVFNKELVLVVDNRKRLLDDIKKFWQLNREMANAHQSGINGAA